MSDAVDTNHPPTKAEADAALTAEQRATQDAIRIERETLDQEGEEMRVRHDLDKEQLRSKTKILSIRCKHPRKFLSGDYSGDTYMVCPDCRWQSGY